MKELHSRLLTQLGAVKPLRHRQDSFLHPSCRHSACCQPCCQDSIPDPSSAHCTGAVCDAHLRVVAANRAAALGGAAGVALAGVREGVVLLLLVPGFHHVDDRAGPAKGAAGKVDVFPLRAHG